MLKSSVNDIIFGLAIKRIKIPSPSLVFTESQLVLGLLIGVEAIDQQLKAFKALVSTSPVLQHNWSLFGAIKNTKDAAVVTVINLNALRSSGLSAVHNLTTSAAYAAPVP